MFGNPETTTWWNALKFFASQRIEIRRGEKLEKAKEQYGYKAKIKVVKNKVAPPFKSAEIVIKFNEGIDKFADIVDAAMELGLISRAGAFYSLGDQKFQGKEKLIEYLKSNPKVIQELESQLREVISSFRGKAVVPQQNNTEE